MATITNDHIEVTEVAAAIAQHYYGDGLAVIKADRVLCFMSPMIVLVTADDKVIVYRPYNYESWHDVLQHVWRHSRHDNTDQQWMHDLETLLYRSQSVSYEYCDPNLLEKLDALVKHL